MTSHFYLGPVKIRELLTERPSCPPKYATPFLKTVKL